MARQDEGFVWMVAGGLGSMFLAVLLIPLRTVTPASSIPGLHLSRRRARG